MKKIFKGGILSLLKTMKQKENEDLQDCRKCENFSCFEGEEKCFIYEYPNHNISICSDFKLSEF